MKLFPRVRELARSKDVELVVAALTAPANMPSWSEPERDALCVWALDFLGDQRAPVVARAAELMQSCSARHVDSILKLAESMGQHGTLQRPQVAALRYVCSPKRRKQPEATTDAQCARTRKVLEAAIASEKLQEAGRRTALNVLATQWPDERTVALVRRYEKSPQPQVAFRAKQLLIELEGHKRPDAPQGPR
jgi:hypothetical protein